MNDMRSEVRHAMDAAALAVALLLSVQAPSLAQQDTEQIDVPIIRSQSFEVPDELTVRARIKHITPEEATSIKWRHGGEGQGGKVVRGFFPKVGASLDQPLEAHVLEVGQWSAPLPIVSMADRFSERFSLTITAGNPGKIVDRHSGKKGGYSTDVQFEFDFLFDGKVIKKLTVEGPGGGTATIVIPLYLLIEGVKPDSEEFIDELTDVLDYARHRADLLAGLPWADWPLPKKYAIINNAGGFGSGVGYGIRTTNRAVTHAELRSLSQLGVNGFRGGPEFLLETLRQGGAEANLWNRAMIAHVMGFPVPKFRAGRNEDPQAGCPFGENVAAETKRMVEESLRQVLSLPVEEVWALTVAHVLRQSPHDHHW